MDPLFFKCPVRYHIGPFLADRRVFLLDPVSHLQDDILLLIDLFPGFSMPMPVPRAAVCASVTFPRRILSPGFGMCLRHRPGSLAQFGERIILRPEVLNLCLEDLIRISLFSGTLFFRLAIIWSLRVQGLLSYSWPRSGTAYRILFLS